MHTPLSVHEDVCVCVRVCVCWRACLTLSVNTSSTLHTNPLTVDKTVLYSSPVFPSHTHTLYAQCTLFHRGPDTRSQTHSGYIPARGVVAFVGAPMSAGMVVGATGQVSFDKQVSVRFSLSETPSAGLHCSELILS